MCIAMCVSCSVPLSTRYHPAKVYVIEFRRISVFHFRFGKLHELTFLCGLCIPHFTLSFSDGKSHYCSGSSCAVHSFSRRLECSLENFSNRSSKHRPSSSSWKNWCLRPQPEATECIETWIWTHPQLWRSGFGFSRQTVYGLWRWVDQTNLLSW